MVVDGSSTDRTEEIARSYDHVRWVSQDHGGVAEAFNIGVEASRGEYVAFIAADDRWEPNKLELQLQALVEHPDLDFVTCRLRFFLSEGQALPPGFRPHLLEGTHVAKVLEALFARRSAFETFGLFDPAFSTALDVEWFGRAADLGATMQVVPELLLHKRVHDRNTSLRDVVDGNRLLLQIAQEALRRKGGLK